MKQQHNEDEAELCCYAATCCCRGRDVVIMAIMCAAAVAVFLGVRLFLVVCGPWPGLHWVAFSKPVFRHLLPLNRAKLLGLLRCVDPITGAVAQQGNKMGGFAEPNLTCCIEATVYTAT